MQTRQLADAINERDKKPASRWSLQWSLEDSKDVSHIEQSIGLAAETGLHSSAAAEPPELAVRISLIALCSGKISKRPAPQRLCS
jgi:hypothetical protein